MTAIQSKVNMAILLRRCGFLPLKDLIYLAFKYVGFDRSLPNEGYYVPNEGYYVPDEGYYVPDEGYYVPNEGYYVPDEG